MSASSGVVRLLEGTTTLAAYQATNSKVTISGDGLTVSVDFTGMIVEGNSYKIECDADFLKDADNNPLTGTLAWDIVMGDYTDPVLADTDPLVPANGQVGGVVQRSGRGAPRARHRTGSGRAGVRRLQDGAGGDATRTARGSRVGGCRRVGRACAWP